MKGLMIIGLLIGLTACDIYYYEPVYDQRDRIVGRYDIEEYSETYNDLTWYTVWIERSNRSSEAIWIDNFYGVNIRVFATVSFDKITIPRQTINGYEVEGVGTVYGSRINFNYRVKDLYNYSQPDFLDATARKEY
jgi:hypothetical protein